MSREMILLKQSVENTGVSVSVPRGQFLIHVYILNFFLCSIGNKHFSIHNKICVI